MLTIETIATIGPDGTLTAKAPAFVPRGAHRVVITLEEAPWEPPQSETLPDMSAFRASLGCKTYPGNAVIDARAEERS